MGTPLYAARLTFPKSGVILLTEHLIPNDAIYSLYQKTKNWKPLCFRNGDNPLMQHREFLEFQAPFGSVLSGFPFGLFVDELNGDILNDSVYTRNLEIENKLNIVFNLNSERVVEKHRED